MLSFHATKLFSTVEGGAVCTDDAGIVQALRDERNFGIRSKECCSYIGGNAKLNEFQAIMGLCNLRHLDAALDARRKAAGLYRSLLSADRGGAKPFPSGSVGTYPHPAAVSRSCRGRYLPGVQLGPGDYNDVGALFFVEKLIVAQPQVGPLEVGVAG